MFYDNTHALGTMFQAFLRERDDILEDLRDLLCGGTPSSGGMSAALLDHFEQWIDEQDIEIDAAHRRTLMHVAEAFIDLVATPEDVQELALVS